MRLLIVKTASMGDVVHATPVVSDILRMRPGVSIDWMVDSALVPLVQMHPGIRQVLPLAWSRWSRSLLSGRTRAEMAELRATLRNNHYDLVLDLQGQWGSAYWASRASCPTAGLSSSSASSALVSLLYDLKATVSGSVHAVHRNRQLAATHLKYALARERPDFGLRAPKGEWLPKGAYAVLIPHASRAAQLWPERHWVAVGRRLAERRVRPMVLWGTEAEQVLAERIAAECDGDVPPYLKLPGVAALLDGARCVVGLDTGFTHLAAALGRNTLALYCEHEPGPRGVVGGAQVHAMGGKALIPGRPEVVGWVDQMLGA